MGADPHFLDPLAHVALTAQGWLEAVKDVNALGKPIVAVGGGGYNQTTVPRMWTLAFAELFDLSLPDETPDTYYFHGQVPRLTDAEPPAVDDLAVEEASRYADQTVKDIERLLLPYHGL
jgi:acetoin utilization protein AcuC